MKELKHILSGILSGARSVDYEEVFGEFANNVVSIEKKSNKLFIYVDDPIARYVLRRQEDRIASYFGGVEEVRILLKR